MGGRRITDAEAAEACALVLAQTSPAAARANAEGSLYATATPGRDGGLDSASATISSHLAANDIVLPIPQRAWDAIAAILASAQAALEILGDHRPPPSATLRAARRTRVAEMLRRDPATEAAAAIVAGPPAEAEEPQGVLRYRITTSAGQRGAAAIVELLADAQQGWRRIGKSHSYKTGDAKAVATRHGRRIAREHAASHARGPEHEIIETGTEAMTTN